MIDLSKLGGGSTAAAPATGGTTIPVEGPVPLPTFGGVHSTDAPVASSPDGDNHNWVWDQFGRALFGSQNTQVGTGQHGGLLGDIPVVGDLARTPGTVVRGLADAGGVGIGAVTGAAANVFSRLPSAGHLSDNAGLGDSNPDVLMARVGLVNLSDGKYAVRDSKDPLAVGAAGFALAQDINKTYGQNDLAAQMMVLGKWQQQNDPTAFAEWQKTMDRAGAESGIGSNAPEMLSHYIREWSVAYADMTPKGVEGWYGTHPELAFAGEGSFGQGLADDLARVFSIQTHAEVGAASLTGSRGGGVGPIPVGPHIYWEKDGVMQPDLGSRMNELMGIGSSPAGFKTLTPVEQQAVVGFRDEGWELPHAYNFLVAHGQGYSSNAGVQTVLGMALDPTFAAGLGATAPAMIAAKAAGYEGVRAGLSVARNAVAEGRITEAASAMTRVIGSSVADVRANPVTGPIAKVARTMVDPLSALPGPKANAMKDVYSTAGASAWEKGFGAPAVSDAARRASAWDVREVFDRAAGSSAMNWARKFSIGRHIDNLSVTGAASARRQITEDLVKELGENAPKDAVSRMADYIYQRREFWLSHAGQEELVRRMVTTTGKTVDEVTKAVGEMSRDEQAVWHDLSYREAFRDFEMAKDSVGDVAEWGELGTRLDDLVPLNPSELDNVAAQGLHSDISAQAAKKGTVAQAIDAWNEAAARYPLIENLGRVKPNGVAELERRLNSLQRIIEDGGLHTALDPRQMKNLPKSFTREFVGKWSDQWRFGFKPNMHQASGLVFDQAGELIAKYEPSIGNVVEGISKPTRGFMPVTDTLARVIPGPVERVADSLEVAAKVARDSVSAQRVMTSMEQKFVKQMRAAGYGAKLARSVFKMNRDYVTGHTMTLAGLNPSEFWEASGEALKDIVDKDVAKRDVFNMLITSAGGDMRLLGLSSGMTQRIRAGLLVRGLNPDNYLGVVTSKTYNALRYILNPTFFLQAEFDAPWFNMYRGVMFDLRGRAPKPGTAMHEMQSIAAALSRSSLSRDLAMDYTERIATVGFQANVLDALKAVPNLETNLGDRIKARLGRMVMNNELAYMNSRIGQDVVDAVEHTRATLLKKAEEAATPEEAALWSDQAAHMDIEHVFDHIKEQIKAETGRMATPDAIGRRYLSEMIDDSLMEVRTKEGLLDYSEHMKKAGYYDPGTSGKLQPLDLDYGASALRLPNIHSVGDLRDAIQRGSYTVGDIRDRMKALGFQRANIDRFVNGTTFQWRSYFDDLRRELGMSRFEMQGIEDLIHNEAKAQGLSSVDYLTQVLPLTAKKAPRASAQAAAAAAKAEASWVAREPIEAGPGAYAHTVANGGGTFDVATGAEMGLKRGYGVGNGPHGIVAENTQQAVEDAYREVSKTGTPHIGTWLNPEDGKVYVDPTQVIGNKAQAIRLARARGEKAIFDFSTFSDIQVTKEATDLGLSGHMKTVLDIMRAAKKGEAGLDDLAQVVSANLHPSMKERLLQHFIDRITGQKGLIEQAMAKGDAKLAQDLNLVLEDLKGGWGGAADRQFRDLVVRRAGGEVSTTGEHLPQPWREVANNPYAAKTELVRVEDILPFREIDREVTPKFRGDFAHLDAITEDIRRNGFREPIILDYDPKTGKALLGEGNHRLAAARRLGLENIPVRVVRTNLSADAKAVAIADHGLSPRLKPDAHGYFPADSAPADIGFQPAMRVAEPEVERAARYFSQYLQSINPSLAGGEVFKDIVDRIPVAGASPHDFTQAVLLDTLAEHFRLAEKDAIRLAHMSTERTVLDRSLNHPFFAMYPTSYFWGKVVPETMRFMAYEPFGLKTGTMAEAYFHVKTSVDLQSQYDPRLKDLWGKVGKSAVLGLFSYLSPSMPWEDMRSNLPPYVRVLGKDGADFGKMLDKEFDTFDPRRWISHFQDAAGEVGDGASTVVDSLTKPQEQALQDISSQFGGMAPATSSDGLKGTVKGTALGPILGSELQDLQAALRR